MSDGRAWAALAGKTIGNTIGELSRALETDNPQITRSHLKDVQKNLLVAYEETTRAVLLIGDEIERAADTGTPDEND